jgi:hypothetical protein
MTFMEKGKFIQNPFQQALLLIDLPVSFVTYIHQGDYRITFFESAKVNDPQESDLTIVSDSARVRLD